MKGSITGLILVSSLILSVSCASPTTTNPTPSTPDTITVPGLPGQPPTGRENVYSVEVGLIPSKTVYMPGEQVQMTLTLTNASQGEAEPVIVSPLPPEISLVIPNSRSDDTGNLEAGTREYYERITGSEIVKTLAPGTDERKLVVGEKLSYDLTWDQKDEEGNQVAPGWYFYESIINVRIESSNDSFGTGGRDRAFLIQYPQGAMEKTLELDQSVTASNLPLDVDGEVKPVDIVFTLKRVELSQERTSFFMVVTSPDDPLSNYERDNWTNTRTEARYEVDSVIKGLPGGNRQFTDEGIEMRFGYGESYLDPIPSDARELTFVITQFGDWRGTWEFKVPLR
ncbi:MAG: hypothetical protein Q8O55_10300 [Dehalococcoidales bacterium]|nr:hypothetical protein [Dehalococcoidales bacterium]